MLISKNGILIGVGSGPKMIITWKDLAFAADSVFHINGRGPINLPLYENDGEEFNCWWKEDIDCEVVIIRTTVKSSGVAVLTEIYEMETTTKVK